MAQSYIGLGRKLPSTRKAEIQGLVPNLPALYAAKEQKAYNDKMLDYNNQMLDLREKEVSNSEASSEQASALAKETLNEEEKRNRMSNLLGMGTLLGNVYAGMSKNSAAANQIFGGGSDDKTGVISRPAGSQMPVESQPSGGFMNTISEAIKARPYSTGAGGLLGAMYSDKLAKMTGINPEIMQYAAPLLGSAAGNIAGKYIPEAYNYVVDAAPKIYSTASEWLGDAWGAVSSWFA